MGELQELLGGSGEGTPNGPGRPSGSQDPERHEEWQKKVAPLKLNSRHRLLMRLLISGTSQVEAAKLMGCSAVRISQLVNSELFKAEMEGMQKEIGDRFVENEADVITECKRRLMGMAEAATKTMEGLMAGAESEQVRAKMAESVLDRVGLKAIDKVEQKISVTVPEGLHDALKANLAEMRKKPT